MRGPEAMGTSENNVIAQRQSAQSNVQITSDGVLYWSVQTDAYWRDSLLLEGVTSQQITKNTSVRGYATRPYTVRVDPRHQSLLCVTLALERSTFARRRLYQLDEAQAGEL